MTAIDIKKQDRNIEVSLFKPIGDEMAQKRYFVAELVKKALDKYLDYDDMVAENTYSLYSLPLVNEDLNIIDFEINSLAVHVIATIDKAKTDKVYIPAVYKQFYYKPDIFLFVNFTKTMAKMDIIGFTTDFDFKVLSIPKEELNSEDNLIDALQKLKPDKIASQANVVNTTKELMLAYVDNDLSEEGKRFFLKHMIQSKEVRRNYKIFYSLNQNFISIARTPKIHLDDPFERERRIDIPTRSDYLMDKAISRYNAENFIEQDSNEEIEEIIENEVEEEMSVASSQAVEPIQQDEILELSLEPLNLQDTEEEVINISDTDTNDAQNEQEQYQEENSEVSDEYEIIEDTVDEELPEEKIIIDESSELELTEDTSDEDGYLPLDDEVIDLAASETEEDFSLNIRDEEEPQIEQIQTENYHAEESDVEVNNEIFSSTEENNADEDLLDIAVDSDGDIFDFIDEVANEVTEEQAIAEEQQIIQQNEMSDVGIQQEEVASTQDEGGEDLFAFLSEIADEAPQQEIQGQAAIEQQQVEPVMNEEAVIPAQPEQNTINNMMSNQNMPQTNMASEAEDSFNQFSQTQQPQPQQYTQQPTNAQAAKEKKPTSPLIPALLCIAAFAVIYKYGTPLLSQFMGNQQVGGIEEEQIDNNIPAPIDASKLEDNAAGNPDAQDVTANGVEAQPVAPPPTAVAQKNDASGEDSVPPVEKAPQLPNSPETTTVEPPKPKHINDAIATALTKDFNGVRISKLSWQASETLLTNPDVKRYLTIAGKSIKNSLSQDLMAATEPSFKDNVSVAITYRKDGTISKIQMDTSSGSKQIDDIIVKSVKDTLNYVKMPALNLNASEYTAKIMIRL